MNINNTLQTPRQSFDLLEDDFPDRRGLSIGSQDIRYKEPTQIIYCSIHAPPPFSLFPSSCERKSSFVNALPTSPQLGNQFNYNHHDDEGLNLWDWINQTSIIIRLRRFINHHSRPDYVLCGISKKNKWRKRVKALVNSLYPLYNVCMFVSV